MPGTLVPSRPGSCWPDLPGLQFELGRGGVRFFVPGLRLTLGRPRSALADGGLLLAVDRAVLTPSELERSSRLGLTWGNGVWLGAAHRLSGRCPRYLEAVVPVLRRRGRACVRAAWLAVPAGVGLGDGEAEFFEFGDQLAQAAVVVEPGAGSRRAGRRSGCGWRSCRLSCGSTGGRGRAAGAGRRGSGSSRGRSGSSGRRGCRAGRSPRAASSAAMRRGLGPLGRGGRHAVIVAAGVPHLAHRIKYKCCMTNADVAAYIGRWRPSSVSPQAAAFARDVIADGGAGGAGAGEEPAVGGGQARRLRARAGPGAGAGGGAAPVGGRAVHPVRAGAVARWRGGRCARTCGSSAAGWCRSCIRRICRCPGNGPSSRTARRRSAGSSRWRTPSPRPERRMRAAGLVCLGAGAGLIRGDLRDVRGTDVACRSGGVSWSPCAAPGRGPCRCWPATTPGCWPRPGSPGPG